MIDKKIYDFYLREDKVKKAVLAQVDRMRPQ